MSIYNRPQLSIKQLIEQEIQKITGQETKGTKLKHASDINKALVFAERKETIQKWLSLDPEFCFIWGRNFYEMQDYDKLFFDVCWYSPCGSILIQCATESCFLFDMDANSYVWDVPDNEDICINGIVCKSPEAARLQLAKEFAYKQVDLAELAKRPVPDPDYDDIPF